MYFTVVYWILLYCSVQYYTVVPNRYCAVVYTIASVLHVVYCSILNFTVLFCSVQYCRVVPSRYCTVWWLYIMYIIIPLRHFYTVDHFSFRDSSHQQKQTPGVYNYMYDKTKVINDEYILWFILFIHYFTSLLIDLSVSTVLCYKIIIHYTQLNTNIVYVHVYIVYSYC